EAFAAAPEFARELGLDPASEVEVHQLRRALRVSPDGGHIPQAIAALTQSHVVEDPEAGEYLFRGGSTIVVDLSQPAVKYRIFKNINSVDRRARTAAFVQAAAADPLRALLYAPDRREPFSALHAFGDVF